MNAELQSEHRQCKTCIESSPSNPSDNLLVHEPTLYPFPQIHLDFGNYAGAQWLFGADQFSCWPIATCFGDTATADKLIWYWRVLQIRNPREDLLWRWTEEYLAWAEGVVSPERHWLGAVVTIQPKVKRDLWELCQGAQEGLPLPLQTWQEDQSEGMVPCLTHSCQHPKETFRPNAEPAHVWPRSLRWHQPSQGPSHTRTPGRYRGPCTSHQGPPALSGQGWPTPALGCGTMRCRPGPCDKKVVQVQNWYTGATVSSWSRSQTWHSQFCCILLLHRFNLPMSSTPTQPAVFSTTPAPPRRSSRAHRQPVGFSWTQFHGIRFVSNFKKEVSLSLYIKCVVCAFCKIITRLFHFLIAPSNPLAFANFTPATWHPFQTWTQGPSFLPLWLKFFALEEFKKKKEKGELIDSESYLLCCNVVLICILLLGHICMSLSFAYYYLGTFICCSHSIVILTLWYTMLCFLHQNMTQSVLSHSSNAPGSEYILCVFLSLQASVSSSFIWPRSIPNRM